MRVLSTLMGRLSRIMRVMVETSDKMWSSGEGNGKPLQYSCLENPMNSMKRQKDRTLKDGLPGAQYAIEDQWRNNSRKNEERSQAHFCSHFSPLLPTAWIEPLSPQGFVL